MTPSRFTKLMLAYAVLAGIAVTSDAQPNTNEAKAINDIAALFKKANQPKATEKDKAAPRIEAAKQVKLIGELSDLMHQFRPVKKGGLGLAPPFPANANVDDMGYKIAAVGEMAYAVSWPRDVGARTKKAWAGLATNLRDSGLALANAKNAGQVKAAVARIEMSCTNCHSTFK